MRRLSLLLILTMALTAGAWAETPGTVELKGSVGYTGFADEAVINHLQTGVSARFYLARRLSVEPEFQYLRESSRHSDIVLVPNVNWDFREGRVVPYITGGIGWVRSEFKQFQPTFRTTETFWQAGGGVKLYVADRWYIAPEARVGWELHFRASVAVGFRLR